jgi:hypothetical protein
MKKKDYIAPVITVVELEYNQSLLTASEEYNGELNAREFPGFEEDDLSDPMVLFKW